MKRTMWFTGFLAFVGSLFLVGCFPHSKPAPQLSKNLSYDQARYADSAQQVSRALKTKNNDVGLLMDLCAYHHYAGNYQSSNEACQKAARQADALYTVSIRERVGAHLTSNKAMTFQGDYHERIFLHIFGMLNYAALGQIQSALVEARKLDNKVSYFKNHPGPIPSQYNDDALGRYISGLLYEVNAEHNDAFIDFRKSIRIFEREPDLNVPTHLPQDAMRTAKRHGMLEEYEELKNHFGIQTQAAPLSKEYGEVIVIFENGLVPYKIKKNFLPYYMDRSSTVNTARVKSLQTGKVAQSQPVRHLGLQVFKRHQERLVHLEPKKINQKMVKNALSAGVGALEFIFSGGKSSRRTSSGADLLLTRSIAADLRGWNTLPAQIDMARLKLKPGKHDLAVKLYGHYGTELFRGVLKDVMVRPGKRTWLIQKLP